MIWDKYREEIDAIPKNHFNAKTYVTERLDKFVGTQNQINDERARLVIEAKEIELANRTRYYEQYNAIVENYRTELYSDYNTPEKVLDLAYAIAYDRGHSSGYSEVECIFEDVVASFIEVYNLGLKDGASGKQ